MYCELLLLAFIDMLNDTEKYIEYYEYGYVDYIKGCT